LTKDEQIEAEIVLTTFLLNAHPDADIDTVLRHLVAAVLRIQTRVD
jgi:hypothetical protein